jgi:hypothetical protein
MINEANKCPGCKNYIIGDYCYLCQKAIRDYPKEEIPDFLKEIFGGFENDKK